jgi:hypothetical protein
MLRQSLCLCAALALPAIFTAGASAATVAYEGFDYTASSLLSGQNGGSGWGSAWSISYDDPTHAGSGTIKTANFSYPGLTTEGLRVVVKGADAATNGNGNGGTSLIRPLSTPVGTPGTTVWFSFMGHLQSWLGNNNLQVGLAFTNGSSQVLSLGQGTGASNANWSLAGSLGSTTQTQITTGTDGGIDHLFVGKIDFGAINTTVNVWADPTLGGAAPGGTSVSMVFAPMTIDGLILRDSQADGKPEFDEIRIGTDFASVQSNVAGTAVPEPASAGLLLLGGMGLLAKRRRVS